MSTKLKVLAVAAIVGGSALTAPSSFAQASGTLGSRTINSYWIEGGTFLAVRGTTPWDNPAGCTKSDITIIPASHPAYKQMLAAVIHAMSTNTPLTVYASGCYSAWGATWPSFYAAGPAW
jgi:hypothetical protein